MEFNYLLDGDDPREVVTQEEIGNWISLGLEALEDLYPKLSAEAQAHYAKKAASSSETSASQPKRVFARTVYSLLVLVALVCIIQTL